MHNTVIVLCLSCILNAILTTLFMHTYDRSKQVEIFFRQLYLVFCTHVSRKKKIKIDCVDKNPTLLCLKYYYNDHLAKIEKHYLIILYHSTLIRELVQTYQYEKLSINVTQLFLSVLE